MAYKTDQSGFSWGLQGKSLETWRRRSEASKKAAETRTKKQAEFREKFLSVEGHRDQPGNYKMRSIFNVLSKKQRDLLRENMDDLIYDSDDILDAAEEIASEGSIIGAKQLYERVDQMLANQNFEM